MKPICWLYIDGQRFGSHHVISAVGVDRFLCPDRVNKTNAEPVLTTLEAKGIRVYSSPLDGSAEQALQSGSAHTDSLYLCGL
jgi:hypothetical protein